MINIRQASTLKKNEILYRKNIYRESSTKKICIRHWLGVVLFIHIFPFLADKIYVLKTFWLLWSKPEVCSYWFFVYSQGLWNFIKCLVIGGIIQLKMSTLFYTVIQNNFWASRTIVWNNFSQRYMWFFGC